MRTYFPSTMIAIGPGDLTLYQNPVCCKTQVAQNLQRRYVLATEVTTDTSI